MFWYMDHSQHVNELSHIIKIILKFFEFAATSNNKYFHINNWIMFSSLNGSDVISDRYCNKKATLKMSIDILFNIDQPRRVLIYEALRHDMRFFEDVDKPFTFIMPTLNPDEQSIVNELFTYFYKNIFSENLFIIDSSNKKYGKTDMKETYFKGKNKILLCACPVCLQSTTSAIESQDIEHFFPQALYPWLALHPYNLYCVCKACNSASYKGEKNPLDTMTSDVRTSFIPYIDTVREKTKIAFFHQPDSDSVKLESLDPSEPNAYEKLSAFQKLFDLDHRWSKMLNSYYDDYSSSYKALNPRTKKELADEMKRDIVKSSASIRVDKHIETCYLKWLHDSQLDAFYSSVAQKDRKPFIV